MKDLLLVRHAKSSWEHPVPDKERPLTEKGRYTAGIVAKTLQTTIDFMPESWWSSSAIRALETAEIFTEQFRTQSKLVVKDDFYVFSEKKLTEAIIKNLDNYLNSAVIFCHNDAITDLVNKIGNERVERIYTSGIAWIRFNSRDWGSCLKNPGETQLILRPKKILP